MPCGCVSFSFFFLLLLLFFLSCCKHFWKLWLSSRRAPPPGYIYEYKIIDLNMVCCWWSSASDDVASFEWEAAAAAALTPDWMEEICKKIRWQPRPSYFSLGVGCHFYSNVTSRPSDALFFLARRLPVRLIPSRRIDIVIRYIHHSRRKLDDFLARFCLFFPVVVRDDANGDPLSRWIMAKYLPLVPQSSLLAKAIFFSFFTDFDGHQWWWLYASLASDWMEDIVVGKNHFLCVCGPWDPFT